MTDIYDIKNFYIDDINIVTLVLFFLGILLIFYFLFFYKKAENLSIENTYTQEEVFSLETATTLLKKNLSTLSKSEFLNELDTIIRSHIFQKYNVSIEEKTYDEIISVISLNKEEIQLFTEIYTRKYAKDYNFDKETFYNKLILLFK